LAEAEQALGPTATKEVVVPKIVASQKSNTYTIEIKAIPPVAFAVPGIRKACKGDIIEFDNQTGGPITVTLAADRVFKGFGKLSQNRINTGKKRQFTVDADSGTHELSIHYRYFDTAKRKWRTGFAIGASSPKIVIVPPTHL
jgi:hypothetical protein